MSEAQRYEGPIEPGMKFKDRAGGAVTVMRKTEVGVFAVQWENGNIGYRSETDIRWGWRPIFDAPSPQAETNGATPAPGEDIPQTPLNCSVYGHADLCMHTGTCSPPAPAAPAHVCKGRPCGEKWTDLANATGSVGDWDRTVSAYGRCFCTTTCRDAWRPEAKVVDDIDAADCADRFCSNPSGPDGVCDTHRRRAAVKAACPGCAGKPLLQVPAADLCAACTNVADSHRAKPEAKARCRYVYANSNGTRCTAPAATDGWCEDHLKGAVRTVRTAQPAPAPWKCSARDCRTPGAPKDALTQTEMCGFCAERRVASLVKERDDMHAGLGRTRQESIASMKPWTILPGEVPARRPATDGLPGGASTVRNDSVWGDS